MSVFINQIQTYMGGRVPGAAVPLVFMSADPIYRHMYMFESVAQVWKRGSYIAK